MLQLSSSALAVMEQLFLNGPTWDGNLVSKSGRDELFSVGYIDTHDGWQWLSHPGFVYALNLESTRDRADKRWYNKQSNQ